MGPLEDNAGTGTFNGRGIKNTLQFSVHEEDTSSLPVPETKFNGSEEERSGQLIVTPEVVASKIKNMKEKQVTRSRWVIT